MAYRCILRRFGFAVSYLSGTWLLTGGTWSDTGVWLDSETWNDS
jgi:hypothetical protein